MIKRLSFATRNPAADPLAWPRGWSEVFKAVCDDAPDAVKPVRVVVAIALPDIGDAVPPHDGIGAEWFRDAEHVQQFERWMATSAGGETQRRLRALRGSHPGGLVPGPTAWILADELVLRGAEWLDERWRAGGERFKHMAIAKRAHGLSAAEFSDRWRRHAGTVRTAAASTPIPDEVRGSAYVQNHPLPRDEGDWPYDAVNEVYFDDLAGLKRRFDWFRANPPAGDGLFGKSSMLACREWVVAADKRSGTRTPS